MSATETNTIATPATKPVAKQPAPKRVTKPAPKVAVKSVAKSAAAAIPTKPSDKPAADKVIAVAKEEKNKKPKMVRDSFTMPKTEFAVLDMLKARALQLKTPVKKTELVRAGIKALAGMSDAGFLAAIRAVPSLKTGRPAKRT